MSEYIAMCVSDDGSLTLGMGRLLVASAPMSVKGATSRHPDT